MDDALDQLIARVSESPFRPGMLFRIYLSNLMPLIDLAMQAGYSRRIIWEVLRDHAGYDRALRSFYSAFDRVNSKQVGSVVRKAPLSQPSSLGSHPLADLAQAVTAAAAGDPPANKPNAMAVVSKEAKKSGDKPKQTLGLLSSVTPEIPVATPVVTPVVTSVSLPGMPVVIKTSRIPQALERIESGLDPLDESEPGEANDIRTRHARTVDEIFSSQTMSNPLLGKK